MPSYHHVGIFTVSCLSLYLSILSSFFVSQGAVIEACTRGVYFVHLFNGEKKKLKSQTHFKPIRSLFSYSSTLSVLSTYVFANIAMYPRRVPSSSPSPYLTFGHSCLFSGVPFHSTGGRGFDHYAH